MSEIKGSDIELGSEGKYDETFKKCPDVKIRPLGSEILKTAKYDESFKPVRGADGKIYSTPEALRAANAAIDRKYGLHNQIQKEEDPEQTALKDSLKAPVDKK